MALTPQPLFRAQDVGTSTVLGPTVPRNWRTKSNKIGDLTLANANEAKPRYQGAAAVSADWIAGTTGDDQSQASASVAIADKNGGPPQANYGPRHQQDRATQLGTSIAQDVGRRRGGIGPKDPYPDKNSAAVPAPTLTTLTPATAAAGNATPQFGIKLIGTGFTVWSEVWMAGVPAPTNIYKYISPTEIRCQMSPASAVPGTATIAVKDHGVFTANQTFTWT